MSPSREGPREPPESGDRMGGSSDPPVRRSGIASAEPSCGQGTPKDRSERSVQDERERRLITTPAHEPRRPARERGTGDLWAT
jgi:hypothetical protein